MENQSFAQRLIAWQKVHGRHHLPWQVEDAYRIWLSEIMLQQTQVSTVIPYFERFIAHFPNISALANATLDDVFAQWSGLGYYRRAQHLHQAAQQVMTEFGGAFPSKRFDLERLKGVGRSTAAAISVFAFNEREAILDGNVKRVLARHAGIFGDPNRPETQKALWIEAENRLPNSDLRAYTQGLMDLGSAICTRQKPSCLLCPVAHDCYAKNHDLTAKLPEKASKTAVKALCQSWMILASNGGFWLEQRPKTGIWGGLWCVPVFDSETSAKRFASEHGITLHALPQREHRLTHRLIEITPFLATLPSHSAPMKNLHWFDQQSALQLGLPTPVREVLESC